MQRRKFLGGALGALFAAPAAEKILEAISPAAAEFVAPTGTRIGGNAIFTGTITSSAAEGGFLVPAELSKRMVSSLLLIGPRGIEAEYEYQFEDGSTVTERETMLDAETGALKVRGKIEAGGMYGGA